jgi:hypothetical protein
MTKPRDCRHASRFDENHARFLNLDDDRLLKVFQPTAPTW